jgi:cytoskeletal protein RodZ
MDLGTDLRAARERAGFTLPELAARTRIPIKSLRAIEENDFAKVPPGIFVRSFIRTYAHEVGVDPTTAIAEFRAITERLDEPAQELHETEVVDEDIQPQSFDPDLSESRPGWGYALMAAALLIGVISVNRYTARTQSDVATGTGTATTTATATATATTSASDISLEPAVSSVSSVAPESPVATSGTEIQIELRAQGPCWVKATVDGQIAFARLLQQGATETVTGLRDVTVRVGDPSALSYSINGRPGQSLGAPNVPVTVRFGPDGLPLRVS